MGGAGGAAGVLLGGVLTDLLSWRWILFINVPIGLTAAFLAHRLIAEGRAAAASVDAFLSGRTELPFPINASTLSLRP